MKTRRSLRYVITHAGSSVRSARRERTARRARDQATSRILVPAIVFVSIGATAVAWSGHGIPGSVQPSLRPAAIWARADSMPSCKVAAMPWMHASHRRVPWMYASPGKIPWMYASLGSSRGAATCPAGAGSPAGQGERLA